MIGRPTIVNNINVVFVRRAMATNDDVSSSLTTPAEGENRGLHAAKFIYAENIRSISTPNRPGQSLEISLDSSL